MLSKQSQLNPCVCCTSKNINKILMHQLKFYAGYIHGYAPGNSWIVNNFKPNPLLSQLRYEEQLGLPLSDWPTNQPVPVWFPSLGNP